RGTGKAGQQPDERSRELTNRELFRTIGAFMDRHGLDPSPANYSLVFRAFREPASEIAAMVEAMTADGLRFTQRDADKIRSDLGLAADPEADFSAAQEEFGFLANATRRTIEDLAQVVQT